MSHPKYLFPAAFLLVSVLAFYACQKDEPSTPPRDPLCVPKTNFTAPPGYKLEFVGTLPVLNNQAPMSLDMLDDNLGFVLGMVVFTQDAVAYKTADGAKNWTRLNTTGLKNPLTLHFINETVGLLSVFDETGCPANCENRTVLYKTEDGGQFWKKQTYPALQGQFRQILTGPDGRLYATLDVNLSSYSIMVSDDGAETWETLYASPELQPTGVKFSFKFIDNHIYASAAGGKVLVINLQGELQQTLETGLDPLFDFTRVSPNAMFAETVDETWRSIDGGQTWELFSTGHENAIDYASAQKVWIVRRVGSCPSDVLFTNDVIATTSDGGETWSESEVSTEIILNYYDMHHYGPDDFLLAIDEAFYRLTAQ